MYQDDDPLSYALKSTHCGWNHGVLASVEFVRPSPKPRKAISLIGRPLNAQRVAHDRQPLRPGDQQALMFHFAFHLAFHFGRENRKMKHPFPKTQFAQWFSRSTVVFHLPFHLVFHSARKTERNTQARIATASLSLPVLTLLRLATAFRPWLDHQQTGEPVHGLLVLERGIRSLPLTVLTRHELIGRIIGLGRGPISLYMLQAGIVGLPNVGKSTLFNALTAQEAALAANYPFATIEPNVGVVAVPDGRLGVLKDLNKAQKIVPATVEFVDIAGLVRGASKGEGLGNQFLANIRETHAVIQVVRCFEDENIIHVEGSVDPIRDIETIQIELALADLASIEKRKDKAGRSAKSGDKDAKRELEIIEKIQPVLEEGRPIRAAALTDDEREIVRKWFLLTSKPTIYAANVDEGSLADPDSNPHVLAVKKHAAAENSDVVVICAKLEAELVALEDAERAEYLKDLGLESSGVDKMIKAAYHMLGLMSFLTAGEKEVRAWTIPIGTKAPQAAGEIHTDIERGFIRAEIIGYDDLVACGSRKAASEKGLARLEGKEYVMQDGDVVDFRFNV